MATPIFLDIWESLRREIVLKGTIGALVSELFQELDISSDQLRQKLVEGLWFLSVNRRWKIEDTTGEEEIDSLDKLRVCRTNIIKVTASLADFWSLVGVEEEGPAIGSPSLAILEIVASFKHRGCSIATISELMNVQKLHHYVDRLLAKGVLSSQKVFEPSTSKHFCVIHLKQFAASFDPAKFGLCFESEFNLKSRIYSLVRDTMREMNTRSIDALELSALLGVSHAVMMSLRAHVSAQTDSPVPCPIRFVEIAKTSRKSSWMVELVTDEDDDDDEESCPLNSDFGSQCLQNLLYYDQALFHLSNAQDGLNSSDLRKILGITRKKASKLGSDLVQTFHLPFQKIQEGKQSTFKIFSASHADPLVAADERVVGETYNSMPYLEVLGSSGRNAGQSGIIHTTLHHERAQYIVGCFDIYPALTITDIFQELRQKESSNSCKIDRKTVARIVDNLLAKGSLQKVTVALPSGVVWHGSTEIELVLSAQCMDVPIAVQTYVNKISEEFQRKQLEEAERITKTLLSSKEHVEAWGENSNAPDLTTQVVENIKPKKARKKRKEMEEPTVEELNVGAREEMNVVLPVEKLVEERSAEISLLPLTKKRRAIDGVLRYFSEVPRLFKFVMPMTSAENPKNKPDASLPSMNFEESGEIAFLGEETDACTEAQDAIILEHFLRDFLCPPPEQLGLPESIKRASENIDMLLLQYVRSRWNVALSIDLADIPNRRTTASAAAAAHLRKPVAKQRTLTLINENNFVDCLAKILSNGEICAQKYGHQVLSDVSFEQAINAALEAKTVDDSPFCPALQSAAMSVALQAYCSDTDEETTARLNYFRNYPPELVAKVHLTLYLNGWIASISTDSISEGAGARRGFRITPQFWKSFETGLTDGVPSLLRSDPATGREKIAFESTDILAFCMSMGAVNVTTSSIAIASGDDRDGGRLCSTDPSTTRLSVGIVHNGTLGKNLNKVVANVSFDRKRPLPSLVGPSQIEFQSRISAEEPVSMEIVEWALQILDNSTVCGISGEELSCRMSQQFTASSTDKRKALDFILRSALAIVVSDGLPCSAEILRHRFVAKKHSSSYNTSGLNETEVIVPIPWIDSKGVHISKLFESFARKVIALLTEFPGASFHRLFSRLLPLNEGQCDHLLMKLSELKVIEKRRIAELSNWDPWRSQHELHNESLEFFFLA